MIAASISLRRIKCRVKQSRAMQWLMCVANEMDQETEILGLHLRGCVPIGQHISTFRYTKYDVIILIWRGSETKRLPKRVIDKMPVRMGRRVIIIAYFVRPRARLHEHIKTQWNG